MSTNLWLQVMSWKTRRTEYTVGPQQKKRKKLEDHCFIAMTASELWKLTGASKLEYKLYMGTLYLCCYINSPVLNIGLKYVRNERQLDLKVLSLKYVNVL